MMLEVLVVGAGYFFLAFSLGWWIGWRIGRKERQPLPEPAFTSEVPTTYRGISEPKAKLTARESVVLDWCIIVGNLHTRRPGSDADG